MKFIPVVINGKIHRMSERAMELLDLEKQEVKNQPLQMQKLPPNLEIIKIQKKEPEVNEVPKEVPVEVKKKEDVIVESTEKPKTKRRGRKVGIEK